MDGHLEVVCVVVAGGLGVALVVVVVLGLVVGGVTVVVVAVVQVEVAVFVDLVLGKRRWLDRWEALWGRE